MSPKISSDIHSRKLQELLRIQKKVIPGESALLFVKLLKKSLKSLCEDDFQIVEGVRRNRWG